MYIIELFFKLKEKFARKKAPKTAVIVEKDAEEEKCEHIFSPIDSTNTVLACVKCGYLIHCSPDEFKKKNIFENQIFEDDPEQ